MHVVIPFMWSPGLAVFRDPRLPFLRIFLIDWPLRSGSARQQSEYPYLEPLVRVPVVCQNGAEICDLLQGARIARTCRILRAKILPPNVRPPAFGLRKFANL